MENWEIKKEKLHSKIMHFIPKEHALKLTDLVVQASESLDTFLQSLIQIPKMKRNN